MNSKSPTITKIKRSLFFKILIGLVGIIGIFFVLLVGFCVYKSIPKTDTFYILNSDFADRDYLQKLEAKLKSLSGDEQWTYFHHNPTLYAHRIGEGSYTVIGYRYYTPGSVLAIDDEGYEKLTIAIPFVKIGEVNAFDLTKDNVVALYSSGGSAWVYMGCTWRFTAGSISIDTTSSSYHVHIKGSIIPMIYKKDYCAEKTNMELDFSAKGIDFSKLTTWLGKPGEYPYAESYR